MIINRKSCSEIKILYILCSKVNTYDLIDFHCQYSSDHLLFKEGRSLMGEGVFLSYEIEDAKKLNRLKKVNYVECSGPSLVSQDFKEVFKEQEERGEVEFFEVDIRCGGQPVGGFYAINALNKVGCTNMAVSEYSISNFDLNNPQYDFDYQVLYDEMGGLDIAICAEMPRELVVSKTLVDKIKINKIKGFVLYSTLDMTMKNRSIFLNI